MITNATRMQAWRLAAAILASNACSGRDSVKEATANGRAVFEIAVDMNAGDTTLAPAQVAGEQEAVDFETFVFDGAGAEGATAGTASERRWPKSAITSLNAGTVTGRVFDAATGQAIATGTVSTAAACTGRLCGPGRRTRTIRTITTTNVQDGTFAFDAATRQLTLAPNTTFRIGAPGYVAVRIAQGPAGAVSDGRSEASGLTTQLPDIYLCRIGSADPDGDSICSAAEARYGTDPEKQDSDGDMLSDAAELYGVWDREVLDIRSLGVDPRRADVLLEVDYVPGRAPTQAGIDAVVAAFANAPPRPEYPSNKPGINLLAWLDDQLEQDIKIDAPRFDAAGAVVQSWFNLRSTKWPIHYGLFASWITLNGEELGASGVSETIPGKIFYVTLHEVEANNCEPAWVPSESDQARTLMHELGHNLGLQHGGGEPTKYKPNYFSVMNYLYQFDALPSPEPDWVAENPMVIDYSRWETTELVENNLDETVGLQVTSDTEGPLFGRPRYCTLSDNNPNDSARECLCFARWNGGVPGEVDFNRDGQITTGVAADLNGYNGTNDKIQRATNDWLSLDFSGVQNALIPQRTVSFPDLCPGPPTNVPVVERTLEDGSTVMEGCCIPVPDTTNRLAADGGMEEVPSDDAPVADAAIATDTSIVDGGVTDTTEGAPIEVDASVGPVSEGESVQPDAGAWGEEPDAGVQEEFGIW